jgi:S-adenosylmethionine:tRNA ribosyltransferase-isomerase
MKLSQFKLKLPEDLIALYPHQKVITREGPEGEISFKVTRRDESRLMVLHRKTGEIEMYKKDKDGQPIKGEYLDFRNIIDYFGPGDTFVLNDTKVFPARLYGTKEKTDAKIEVFILRELNEETHLWDVLVEPARKIRIGNKLFFDEVGTMVAEVYDNTTSRGRSLRFLYDCDHEQFKHDLFALGEAPLPRYIFDLRTKKLNEELAELKRKKQEEAGPDEEVKLTLQDMKPIMDKYNAKTDGFVHATEEDMEDFQCVFAKNEGAVTAPATGLHFSRELMKRIEIKDINMAYITLHCGLGNFAPIEVEDLTKHKMDSEEMIVGKEACDIVNRTKLSGHHVCVVGSSVAKATETAVGTDGLLKEYEGWTSKFIFPPYEYGLADSMLANFYHPESTNLMATAAFGGYESVMECYNLAIENGYKFGCFGDSLLIVD